MGKRQAKKTIGWSRLAVGTAVSLSAYLAGVFILALLIVNGITAADREDMLLAVWAIASSACGSLLVRHIKGVTPLLACLLQGMLFMLSIIAISYLFWSGPIWNKSNVAILLCAMVGGLLPGLYRGRGGHRRKWK